MKILNYNNNNIVHLYLTKSEIETILNSFTLSVDIYKNMKDNYIINYSDYKKIKNNIDNTAQNLYNIYINSFNKKRED